MIHPLSHFLKTVHLVSAACLVSLWLSGCSTPAPTPQAPMPAPAPVKPVAPIAMPTEPTKPTLQTSSARTAREYRLDAAKHLYKLNGDRIFKGRMPPMLYAVGVLDVEIDKKGQVTRTNWVRAPGHAPEVMREIEKTARQAAPYPIPAHMGKVVYTDVWLWHKSGRFQLDTLTEGQD